VVSVDHPVVPVPESTGAPVSSAIVGAQEVTFDKPAETPVYDRAELEPGHEFPGPALVVEDHATTLVPMGWRIRVEGTLALRVTPQGV